MRNRTEVLYEHTEESVSDQCEQQDDVQVRGWREKRPRLLKAAKVGQRHEGDKTDAQRDSMRLEAVERGNYCRNTGGNRNGNGEDVVDQHRSASNQRRDSPEIFPRDHVRPATVGVGKNRLSIATDHDDEKKNNKNGNWDKPAVSGNTSTGKGHKHDQDFFSCVCC